MRLFTCVYGGTFQKHRVFTAGGRHATEGNPGRQDRILYHMEARTLYARRMFREKWGTTSIRPDPTVQDGSTLIPAGYTRIREDHNHKLE